MRVRELSFAEAKEIAKQDRSNLRSYEVEGMEKYRTGNPEVLAPKTAMRRRLGM
ncbi:hypothetical protein ACFSMW_10625 [Virgibacillus halophilus]|uniref:Uncharacterized protein n=1 Tax=Tigheibacillus halophilus TaxID=361280 RepID=A0ABU5C8P3_9BACI|nr:hypothetical protein [Virgibacillus halophilus]